MYVSLVALFGVATVSQADPNTLPPGAYILPVAGGPGPGAGATLLYSTNYAWAPSSYYVGSLDASVWMNDANNPYNGLTFTYQLILQASSSDEASSLAIGGYTGFNNIDVTYESSSSGTAPNEAQRSSDGSTLHFNFFSDVQPGTDTAILVVDTGAPAWSITSASVEDSGSPTPSIITLSPVPEPTSLAWLTAGVGGLAALAARKQRKRAGNDANGSAG